MSNNIAKPTRRTLFSANAASDGVLVSKYQGKSHEVIIDFGSHQVWPLGTCAPVRSLYHPQDPHFSTDSNNLHEKIRPLHGHSLLIMASRVVAEWHGG